MADAVLSFVLDQLANLVREKGRLLGGLRQEVQLIIDELGHMKAFLKVAESKEEDDPRLQEWIRQVREAAYDTEDVLDDFVHRFADDPARGFYGSIRRIFYCIKNLRARGFYGSVRTIVYSIKNLLARHRLASDIQSIKSRITNIAEQRQRYQSEYGILEQDSGSSSGNNSWLYSRDDALLVEEAKLIGIEKPKQLLISHLLNGDHPQLKVISVVGMGGLGKTTLVKKVHEDLKVKRHFPVRAWITVSQICNFVELLQNLIRQLQEEIKKPVPPRIESMTDTAQLKEFIKDFLQEAGRYTIVFDDVWCIEFWNEIKFALPENIHGNRVMLTTRIADVAFASCIQSQDIVYKMNSLSFDQSWTLFRNKVFKDRPCPDHLRNVAIAVLSKCEGLPLAIVAISGLLALTDVSRPDEWETIRCSLGGELEGSGKLDRVNKILCLSYNGLPSHLKKCLLYMSIFPEDFEINCYQLVRLWIAETFVGRREGMSIEDVAYGYLRELANRSLIQVSDVYYEGMPSTCRIHDLLREIIVSKSKEQNMVAIATGQHMIRWPSENVRRLAIHHSSNFLSPNSRSQYYYCFDHLRSLIIFGGSMEAQAYENLLSEILSGSKLLKVLDLRAARTLEEIPNKIFNLFRLQYLCLQGTSIRTVPKSIGKLVNLEYLDLSRTKVREVPMQILKLQKLRHLRVYELVTSAYLDNRWNGFKGPSKIGTLLSLRTLCYIDATSEEEKDTSTSRIVKEIGKLRDLRILGITNLRREDGKELCSSLANLINLRQLDISSSTGKDNGGDFEVIDLNRHHLHHHHQSGSSSTASFLQSLRLLRLIGRLEKIPQWVMGLQGLVSILLKWSGLRDEDSLECLQHLPNLVNVTLINQAYQGEGLCFKAGGFLKLKELSLQNLQGLRWMRVEEGAMPRLRKLTLQQLPLVEELPFGIQHLTHLQILVLCKMSSQLVNKVKEDYKKQSEDYKRIAHIPEVTIFY